MTMTSPGLETPSRRVRCFRLDIAFLLKLLRSFDGTFAPILVGDLPEDAKIVGIRSLTAHTVEIDLESATWPSVPLDQACPPLTSVRLRTWQLSPEEIRRQHNPAPGEQKAGG